ARLSEAVLALARASGLSMRDAKLPAPPRLESSAQLADWLPGVARWIGLDAEPVECAYADIEQLVTRCSPALLQLPGNEPRFLAVIGAGRRLRVVGPDGHQRRVPVALAREALAAELERSHRDEIDRLLDEVKVAPGSRERARRAMLCERLSNDGLEVGWLLRPEPGCLRDQIKQERVVGTLVGLVATYVLYAVLGLVAWWLLGRGALDDRFDPGWLSIWVLALLTTVPFWLLSSYFAGTLAIRVGTIIKSRLLTGALRLEPDEIRHQGIGQLLGRVIESEVVETLGVAGAIQGMLAVLELGLCIVVLAMMPGALLPIVATLAWAAISFVLFEQYVRRKRTWTRHRLELTHSLVEQMVGHRTRLAQEAHRELHVEDDKALSSYVEHGHSMDRVAAALVAVLPRGYLLLGALALAPAFLRPGTQIAALAIGVGGVLLGYRAFHRLADAMSSLAGAALSFEQVRDLAAAANRTAVPGLPDAVMLTNPQQRALEVRHLAFQHHGRSQPVLRDVNLQLSAADRVLLEGGSGSGKSTFAAVVAGLRAPDAGLLLLGNIDRQTLGAELWRRRVVLVPQFHENHILSGRLAFNLLMGNDWPSPTVTEDIARAEAICRALDLGPLLDRMPGGIMQMVGEVGWQLSHGEKSRVFLARALLQGADVVVLDESFGALDPETLEHSLRHVIEHAPALIVIAHP
ncbi:MAG: ATP-binding cassette domain-containing protein, partial [Kofleriaceae bacterium]